MTLEGVLGNLSKKNIKTGNRIQNYDIESTATYVNILDTCLNPLDDYVRKFEKFEQLLSDFKKNEIITDENKKIITATKKELEDVSSELNEPVTQICYFMSVKDIKKTKKLLIKEKRFKNLMSQIEILNELVKIHEAVSDAKGLLLYDKGKELDSLAYR